MKKLVLMLLMSITLSISGCLEFNGEHPTQNQTTIPKSTITEIATPETELFDMDDINPDKILASELFVPKSITLETKTNLVVMLHGCGQNEKVIENESKWNKLAKEKTLLFYILVNQLSLIVVDVGIGTLDQFKIKKLVKLDILLT